MDSGWYLRPNPRGPRSDPRIGQIQDEVSSSTEPIPVSHQLRRVWSAPPALQGGGVMTRCTSIRQQDISDRQTQAVGHLLRSSASGVWVHSVYIVVEPVPLPSRDRCSQRVGPPLPQSPQERRSDGPLRCTDHCPTTSSVLSRLEVR